MSVTAIVPLKALPHAKQRLADHLSAVERRTLMGDLFAHVLRTCRATDGIDRVVAVVGDDTGAELAERAGVEHVREPGGGLNAALRSATGHVRTDASLIVVADLPQLTVDDLRQVVAAGTPGPCVVVAATLDGGTGALLRRPAGVIDPAFGGASAAAHLDAAQGAGVRAVLLASPGLSRDVDRPVDLERYAGLPADPEPG